MLITHFVISGYIKYAVMNFIRHNFLVTVRHKSDIMLVLILFSILYWIVLLSKNCKYNPLHYGPNTAWHKKTTEKQKFSVHRFCDCFKAYYLYHFYRKCREELWYSYLNTKSSGLAWLAYDYPRKTQTLYKLNISYRKWRNYTGYHIVTYCFEFIL